MRHEHEPIRLPTWWTSLRAFEAARDAYAADPTPTNLRLAQRLGALLGDELARPGRFPLGRTLITVGAYAAMAAALHLPAEFLLRHRHGDWGELVPEDRRENERALLLGSRILSVYRTRADQKLLAITDGDRRATTLLLPEEY